MYTIRGTPTKECSPQEILTDLGPWASLELSSPLVALSPLWRRKFRRIPSRSSFSRYLVRISNSVLSALSVQEKKSHVWYHHEESLRPALVHPNLQWISCLLSSQFHSRTSSPEKPVSQLLHLATQLFQRSGKLCRRSPAQLASVLVWSVVTQFQPRMVPPKKKIRHWDLEEMKGLDQVDLNQSYAYL